MRTISYAQALVEAQAEEMVRDERVFLMGEDVGRWGGGFEATLGLYERFGPERVRDTPVSESAIIGAAAGAALAGMRPIAEMQYMEFLAYVDGLVNQVAKLHYMSGGQLRLPLVLRGPFGAKMGNGAQHSQYLEAWFMHVPGLRVVMPSTPYDAKGLLKTAVRDDNPVVFIEEKTIYYTRGEVPDGEYTIPFGQADVKRSGKDVTVVATSVAVARALNAARQLAREGIEVEVVDPRTLNPLDIDTIVTSVRKTHRLVVAHMACKTCGIGAEIATQVTEQAFDYLDGPVVRVAGLDTPAPYYRELEKLVYPSEEDIAAAIRQAVG